MPIDHIVADFVEQHLRAPWLTPAMIAISDIATAPVLIVIVLVLAAFGPGRRPGWFCTLNLAGSTLLNQTLKFLIQRPRPDEALRLVEIGGYSFPSGHSMAAMSFFGLLIWLVWRYVEPGRKRTLLTAAFGIVIVLVGVSRIYLGVHYLTDVLAGFTISLIWLVLYTRLAGDRLLGPRTPH